MVERNILLVVVGIVVFFVFLPCLVVHGKDEDDDSFVGRALRMSTQERSMTRGEEEGPKMMIHIGPHKTGTSTIQSVLSKLDFEYNILQRDNLYYMGKVDGVDEQFVKSIMDYANANYTTSLKYLCAFPILHGQTNVSDRCQRKFTLLTNRIQQHYDLGHDIIISDEDFETYLKYLFGEGLSSSSSNNTKVVSTKLMQFFLPLFGDYWPNNIHILYTYRRFYEWHFSRYKEHGKQFITAITNARHTTTDDDTWNHPDIVKGYDTYPQIISQTFNVMRDYHYKRFNPIYFHTALPQYLTHSQTTLLNLHATNDFIHDFICHTLLPLRSRQSNTTTTNHSCNYLQAHRSQFTNARVREPNHLQYAFITKQVQQRYGKQITNCYTPATVFMKISHYHDQLAAAAAAAETETETETETATATQNQTRQDFLSLTNCLSQEEADFLQTQTIQDEKELFPQFYYHQGGKQTLHDNFQTHIQEHTFCAVDYDAFFSPENPYRWDQWFDTMIQNCNSS